MIALARHIESLLLKHDCVIVPDFGGFVTQQVSARYVEDEGLFLPPYRSVGFNGCLKLNDGLLAQSYRNAAKKKKVTTVSPVISHAINQASASADSLPDKGH